MKELYGILDVDNDGFIDIKDWEYNFPDEVVTGTLQSIKDVIFKQ